MRISICCQRNKTDLAWWNMPDSTCANPSQSKKLSNSSFPLPLFKY